MKNKTLLELAREVKGKTPVILSPQYLEQAEVILSWMDRGITAAQACAVLKLKRHSNLNGKSTSMMRVLLSHGYINIKATGKWPEAQASDVSEKSE